MLAVRGVSLLVAGLSEAVVRTDLTAIRGWLGCDSVQLIGTDPVELVGAARTALGLGLDVWLRPSREDAAPTTVLDHLAGIAELAEGLRQEFPGWVTLLVGSEFSLTSRGIVPGRWLFVRLTLILRFRRLLHRRITRRVNRLLARTLAVARAPFAGPISYAAAGWEDVAWDGFDLVGVNLYRYGTDADRYRREVDEMVAGAGRPVVVTEFGCGAFAGADERGAGAFRIVNWFADPPVVRGEHPREEAVQARYLAELIDVYETTGVHGCFAFTFAMRDFPHRDDPHHDLDKAGFGLVAVSPDDPADWRPKQAFDAVAARFARP